VIEIIDLYRAIEPDVLAEETRLRVQRSIAEHALVLGDLPLAIDYFSRITSGARMTTQRWGTGTNLSRAGESGLALRIILRRADLADIPSVEVAPAARGGQPGGFAWPDRTRRSQPGSGFGRWCRATRRR